jgi:DDE superfamily endonuclease
VVVVLDCSDELGHMKASAADALACDLGKPAFDLIQPRGTSRGKVKVITRVCAEPLLYLRMLMRCGLHNGGFLFRSTLARMRRAGYRWRKARRVFTSPDPSYHEKVELLLKTLRSLGEDEMFFFLDEWGPIQVRKRGGKAYRRDHATIPRHQVSRGSVSLIAALSATTNQVTWHFLESTDSHAMMDVVEILHNQYHTKTKLYVTWDGVACHNSGPFLEALDQFNDETRASSVGPIIELVPLPTSSQFLNVIEGVLSGMTRAVINNSDYPDAAQMKQAISTALQREECAFRHNPRRVGKKIWEFDFFQDFDTLRPGTTRSGRYNMGDTSLLNSSQ